MVKQKIHPGWIAATVTFFTLMASAGYRSAPSVLIVPLEEAFGWSRSQISLAVSINVLLFGLVAPFAAALMERFTIRKVVMSALTLVVCRSQGNSRWSTDSSNCKWTVGLLADAFALCHQLRVEERLTHSRCSCSTSYSFYLLLLKGKA